VLTGSASQAANWETAIGGAGNDTLVGNALANTLTGSAGNDTLNGRGGNDNLRGGTGNDNYLFNTASGSETDTVTEQAGAGTDTLDFSSLGAGTPVTINLASATTTLATHSGRTVLVASAGQAANWENATGGSGNDVIFGNGLANTLTGAAGNDILVGNAGADSLRGGTGRDILIGGTGADSLTGHDGDDILLAGTTSYDANIANLQTVLAEWTSGNSYNTRITNLRNGINGVQLTSGVTAFNDSSVDTLTGSGGQDWIFKAIDDVFSDPEVGEIFDTL
jgi:hypothetical protein